MPTKSLEERKSDFSERMENVRVNLAKEVAKSFREERKKQMSGGAGWIERASRGVAEHVLELTDQLCSLYGEAEQLLKDEAAEQAKKQKGKVAKGG